MKGIVKILRLSGFTKARWVKCPQGFKESGYPCYRHKDGSWCELYFTDKIPYGQIWLTGLPMPNRFGGRFFENKNELKKFLSAWEQTKK